MSGFHLWHISLTTFSRRAAQSCPETADLPRSPAAKANYPPLPSPLSPHGKLSADSHCC